MAFTNFRTSAPGDRVQSTARPGRLGTITRVIDADGAIGGLVEVRWDGQRTPSRSAGFFSASELAPANCTGCALCDPREAARDEAVWASWA